MFRYRVKVCTIRNRKRNYGIEMRSSGRGPVVVMAPVVIDRVDGRVE